jgi:hypothetical protein
VETPRICIIAKLSVRVPGPSSVLDGPGTQTESFAIINIRGVSTKSKTLLIIHHANLQGTYQSKICTCLI